MAVLEKLGRLARLAGLLGVASASLLLAQCSHRARVPGPDAGGPDLGAGVDRGADTAERDGPTAADAGQPPDSRRVDKRLWDVLCE